MIHMPGFAGNTFEAAGEFVEPLLPLKIVLRVKRIALGGAAAGTFGAGFLGVGLAVCPLLLGDLLAVGLFVITPLLTVGRVIFTLLLGNLSTVVRVVFPLPLIDLFTVGRVVFTLSLCNLFTVSLLVFAGLLTVVRVVFPLPLIDLFTVGHLIRFPARLARTGETVALTLIAGELLAGLGFPALAARLQVAH